MESDILGAPVVHQLGRCTGQYIAASYGVQSFSHAIEEGVANALFSGSSSIHVEVDCTTLAFAVQDDGNGFQEEALHELCSMVLKGQPKGFLRALVGCATVQITTTSNDSFETYDIVFNNGSIIRNQRSVKRGARTGTRLIAADLWSQVPVRRQRQLDRARDELSRARNAIMELALAFPSTEITVVDVVTRQRILHAAGGRTPLQGLKWAFGSAAEDARGFRIGRGKMTVAGDVLLPPLGTENPRGQLIYVNKRPARAEAVARAVKELFRAIMDKLAQRHMASGELTTHYARGPAYIIKITCDPSSYSVLYDTEGRKVTFHDPVHVVRLLRGGLLEAWAPVVPLSELDCAGQYNDEWQRATVGDAPAGDAVAEHCSQDLVEWLYQQCGRTGTARDSGGETQRAATAVTLSALQSGVRAGEGRLGVSPVAGSGVASKAISVGQFEAVQAKDAMGDIPSDNPPTKGPSGRGVGALTVPAAEEEVERGVEEDEGQGVPLAAMLAAWEKPTSRNREPRILTLDEVAVATCTGALTPARPSSTDLKSAVALGQIDDKFIPLVCQDSKLCIMDQHAADERIRLEELQRECLGPHGAPRSDHSFHLTAPSRVELTHGEAELLSQYRGKVESWGWRYTCEAPTEVGTVVVLTAVPRVAGFLLSGVDLKLFLMELAEAGGSSGAPPGVHRALASRACRSAIMFGDRLSTAQARTLLSCMAACRQLHICAHGRPTVTSLVSLRQLRRAQMALQEPLLSAPPRRRATQIAHGLAASI